MMSKLWSEVSMTFVAKMLKKLGDIKLTKVSTMPNFSPSNGKFFSFVSMALELDLALISPSQESLLYFAIIWAMLGLSTMRKVMEMASSHSRFASMCLRIRMSPRNNWKGDQLTGKDFTLPSPLLWVGSEKGRNEPLWSRTQSTRRPHGRRKRWRKAVSQHPLFFLKRSLSLSLKKYEFPF